MQVFLKAQKLAGFQEIKMVCSFLALKSLLQISLNLIRWNIILSKFVNFVFYFVSILDIMPIYLDPIFIIKLAYSNIQALLINDSKSLVIKL